MKKTHRVVSLLLAFALVLVCAPPATVQAGVGDGIDANTPMTHPNTYINTGDQRKDIIGVALTQVGYTELNHSNNTKYGAALKINHLGWCGAFVSWCAIEANIPNSVLSKTGVPSPASYGLTEKYYPAYTPQPGDLFFAKDNSHVGLVYYVEGDYFWSIEGNVSYNSYEGVHVERHLLSAEKYASPNYQNSQVIVASGDCSAEGSNVKWALDEDGMLTITGTGDMADYTANSDIPWYSYKDSVKKAVIGSGVNSIGDRAFFSCINLTGVTISDSVTIIGASAFQNCTGLTDVTMGNSVTTIGNYAFYGCEAITGITIPDSVTTIGDQAFIWCTGLTSLVLPNSVTALGSEAFSYCTGLAGVTFGNSVKIIGDMAFYGCSSLTAVSIPDSVTYVGESAFYECSGLTDLTMGSSVSYIGTGAFGYCVSLKTVELPSSLKTIGNEAFWSCNSLTSVEIPASVTTLGNGAFGVCGNLTDIQVAAENTEYSSQDGVLFNKDKTVLLSYPTGKAGAYTIPNTVKEISVWAFQACMGLTALEIPDSVTTIGESAFFWCNKLTEVALPDSVTSIGDFAFGYCQELTKVKFGKSVASIKSGAFAYCAKLSEIVFEGSAPTIGADAFSSTTPTASYYPDETWTSAVMQNYGGTITWEERECDHDYAGVVTVPVIGAQGYTTYTCTICGNSYVDDYTDILASGKCGENVTWQLKIDGTLTIAGTGTMDDYAYVPATGSDAPWIAYQASIQKIVIEDGVTALGEYAFACCSVVTEVNIPNSVATIGEGAFLGCEQLASVIVPASVTVIGNSAFQWCPGLKEIRFEGGAPTIGENAFYSETLTAYYRPGESWTDSVMQNYGGTVTWQAVSMPGDFDGDDAVTDADVIHLLWHTVFPEDYPLNGEADFNGDGMVTDADVIHLLWHTVFPEDYPLQ